MESLDAFIDRLPKVELHLHLVGSASVPTVLELARRHPDGAVPQSAAELAACYEFRDFPHFAEVYAAVSSLVREPADVAELVLGAARDEEGALIAILWLEVLHPSRPWHTAVLGATLIAYLLATHLAESAASLSALRPQIRVLAVGAGLPALGAAAGMLPEADPGAGSALLRLVAAGALIAAAGLALPYVARHPGTPDNRRCPL